MADRSAKVVGLKYQQDHGLPRVILKGGGKQAEQIIAEGKRIDGPPRVKDEQLLEALYRLPVDGEIGAELFELVAALLVHVYAIDEQLKGVNGNG